MPRFFRHVFSPFVGGQNTVRDPQALASGAQAPEEGFRATGAELRSGLLRGIYGPGSVAAGMSFVATTRFFFYVEDTGWVAKQMNTDFIRPNWAVRDSHGTWDNVTYMTDIASDNTVSVPRIHYGGTSYPMGLTAPTAAPTSNNAGAGLNIQIRYTYAMMDGTTTLLESNPSPRTATLQAGDTITVVDPTATQTRVTHAKIYSTKPDDPDGLLYYLASIAFGATTYVTTSPFAVGTPDLAQPLDWDAGGNQGETIAVDDHAQAPPLTCMSNTLHGGENRVDGNFTGFLVAAVDQTIVWSVMGQPQYWPAKNAYRIPDTVLAIISVGTNTYVFTETAIWHGSGASPNALQWTKTRVDVGPMLAAGKSVVSTPFGIPYVSRDGVMLFNGIDATNLTRESLPASDIQAYDYWTACFIDDYFVFSNAEDTAYMLDLRSLPTRAGLVKLAPGDEGVPMAFHRMRTIPSQAVPEGLYAIFAGDVGDSIIRPWRPDSRAVVAGAERQDVQYKTGRLTFGDATRHKQLTKYRLDGTGTVTMSVFKDPTDLTSDASPAHSVALALPMREARWFPRNCAGKTFSILFDVPSGAELAPGSHIEGVTHG